MAIYNRLKSLPGEVVTVCDSLAASAGSIIYQAGDVRQIYAASAVMVHHALTCLWGMYNAADMRDMAASLDDFDKQLIAVYLERTGLDEASILAYMDAESWMVGQEAVDAGFADEVVTGAAQPVEDSGTPGVLNVGRLRVAAHYIPALPASRDASRVHGGIFPQPLAAPNCAPLVAPSALPGEIALPASRDASRVHGGIFPQPLAAPNCAPLVAPSALPGEIALPASAALPGETALPAHPGASPQPRARDEPAGRNTITPNTNQKGKATMKKKLIARNEAPEEEKTPEAETPEAETPEEERNPEAETPEEETAENEITTVEELREMYPDLVEQIEQAAREQGAEEENARLAEIEEIEDEVDDPDETAKAKYGAHAERCDASALLLRAAKARAGRSGVRARMARETAGSARVKTVEARKAPAADSEQSMTAALISAVTALNGKKAR